MGTGAGACRVPWVCFLFPSGKRPHMMNRSYWHSAGEQPAGFSEDPFKFPSEHTLWTLLMDAAHFTKYACVSLSHPALSGGDVQRYSELSIHAHALIYTSQNKSTTDCRKSDTVFSAAFLFLLCSEQTFLYSSRFEQWPHFSISEPLNDYQKFPKVRSGPLNCWFPCCLG